MFLGTTSLRRTFRKGGIQSVAPPNLYGLHPTMEEADELARIVEAAREAVSLRSLRAVARQIGMSPTGLQGVLNGAEAYDKTRIKLRTWYAGQQGLEGLPVAAAADVIVMLVRTVPSRKAGVRRVLNAVEAAHAAGGVPLPTWLAPVREKLLGETQ